MATHKLFPRIFRPFETFSLLQNKSNGVVAGLFSFTYVMGKIRYVHRKYFSALLIIRVKQKNHKEFEHTERMGRGFTTI